MLYGIRVIYTSYRSHPCRRAFTSEQSQSCRRLWREIVRITEINRARTRLTAPGLGSAVSSVSDLNVFDGTVSLRQNPSAPCQNNRETKAETHSCTADEDTAETDDGSHGKRQSELHTPVRLSRSPEVVEPHAGFHSQTENWRKTRSVQLSMD